ncbi:hypothetical protein RI367_003213 [Sorochytrium milnesiophthora]
MAAPRRVATAAVRQGVAAASSGAAKSPLAKLQSGPPVQWPEHKFAKRVYVDIHGNMTETLQWKAVADKTAEPLDVMLLIPGNPGVVDYYEDFLDTVYAQSGQRMDIYAVQHFNHSLHAHLTPHFFGLQDQLRHKLHFLNYLRREYHGRSVRIHMVGHSIGCWICLQLLRIRGDALKNCLGRVVLLFPTIANIRDTPNGRFWKYMTLAGPRYLTSLLMSFLLFIIPAQYLSRLVQRLSGQTPKQALISAKLVHPTAVGNCLYMAQEEMVTLRELDPLVPVIDRFIDHLVFYYGTNDNWAPLHMWEEVRNWWPDDTLKDILHALQRFPNADIRNAVLTYFAPHATFTHVWFRTTGRDNIYSMYRLYTYLVRSDTVFNRFVIDKERREVFMDIDQFLTFRTLPFLKLVIPTLTYLRLEEVPSLHRTATGEGAEYPSPSVSPVQSDHFQPKQQGRHRRQQQQPTLQIVEQVDHWSFSSLILSIPIIYHLYTPFRDAYFYVLLMVALWCEVAIDAWTKIFVLLGLVKADPKPKMQ